MSLSAQYKQYTARAKREGKTPISFDSYKAMADVRAKRGNGTKTKRQTKTAVQVVAERNGNGRQHSPVQSQLEQIIAQAQAQLEALNTPEEAPQAQASAGHVEIKDPNALATGRQLWKLNELGLLGNGQLTKGIASDMLDKALNS